MKKIILGLTLISTMILASDGASLYKKCSGCHGDLGQKKALGKSKVINEMSKVDLITALTGYQDGSYGGPMKGLMKGQVAKFSEEEIAVLAEYISTNK